MVDDRELEALAAVDRQHLDGLGVGVEPAAALLVGVVAVGVGDPLPQPRRQRGGARAARSVAAACSSSPTWRRSVSRRSPSTVASTRSGSASVERDRLEQRRDAARRAARAPSGAGAGAASSRRRRPRRRPARRVQPRNEVSAAARARGGRRRALERLEQPQPVARRLGVANTLPAPLITAGTPTRSSASRTQRGVAVACERAPRRGRARIGRARPVPTSIGARATAARTTSAARSRGDVPPRAARASVALRGRPTTARAATTRIRSGAVTGAPGRRGSRCARRATWR